MSHRTKEQGRFQVPSDWPAWKKRCGAMRRGKEGKGIPCRMWAVRGMKTCRIHGSGGERNKELGELRYLAWVIAGVPQDMPIEHAIRFSLAMFAEIVLDKAAGNPSQQMKAALWLTGLIRDLDPTESATYEELRSATLPEGRLG